METYSYITFAFGFEMQFESEMLHPLYINTLINYSLPLIIMS
jgi:hypothetical protein